VVSKRSRRTLAIAEVSDTNHNVSLDEDVRYFSERFRKLLSKPQYEYFVTVLLNLALHEVA